MTTINIKDQLTTKKYLENFVAFEFTSLFHLIVELFDNYLHGQKEIIEIETLLNTTGYSNLKEIPQHQIEKTKELIRSSLQEWKRQEDTEYMTFKLLAAIVERRVIVIIDDNVIDNPEKEISITANSNISFIDNTKLNSITFTTL